MDPVARADIWRCLIGYGVSPGRAAAICETDGVTLRSALALSTGPERISSVRVAVTTPGDVAVDRVVAQVDQLGPAARQAVLAHHVAGIAPEHLALTVDADHRDLEAAEAILGGPEDPQSHTAILLAPLSEMETPAALTSRQGKWLGRTVLAVGAVALAGLWLLVAQTTDPAPATAERSVAAPPVADQTSPEISSTTSSTVQFREPDREIEVSVTEANTIVRQEPWTRRVIWESSPFLGTVEIVSVDPNTLTLDYGGSRLLMSLTDGTLLPP